ncbi:MAG: hypothetical protein GW905_08940 [Rhodobacterales bacterium]|nr:hypothetical protein [Rhodobacterales bacterium]
MRRIRVIAGLLLVVAVAGCGVPQRLGFNRVAPEAELPFRSKLNKGETPRQFSVEVAAGGADIGAIRESVRHPATGFCLLNFGGSDIDWDLDASGEWRAMSVGVEGDLVFSGTCAVR